MPSTGLTEVFVTLLNRDPQNPGFIVEESQDNNQIIITPSNHADTSILLGEIEEVFKSQAGTLSHIPFNLMSTDLTPQDIIPEIENPLLDFSEIYALDATKVLERFFGIEKLNNIGCQPQWKEVKTNSNQNVYRAICSKREMALRTSQVDTYKYILSNASWEELYLVLAKNNHKHLEDPKDSDEYGKGPLSMYLEQLFSIREEQGKTFIYFDCIGLIKCILAPKFALTDQKTVAGCDKIVVDKSHFMLYMSTILNKNQGILFHQHKEGRIVPISIACRNTIQSKTLIDFGIDCTGSMQSVFPKLKELLKKLITKLYEYNDLDNCATEIRLSRFGSSNSNFPIITALLSELGELNSAIDTFQCPDSSTAIYKFLHIQHTSYKQLKDYNIISILISDGKDNEDSKDKKYEHELPKTLLYLNQETNPPQFFSMEIGNDVQEDVLQDIQKATCGIRIKVGNSLENFDEIFDYIGKLALYRRFIHFAQKARSFKLPAIEGSVIIANPENYLELNEPFTINNGDPMVIRPNHSKSKVMAVTETQTVETQTEEALSIAINMEQNVPELIFSNNQLQSSRLPFCGFKKGFLLENITTNNASRLQNNRL